MNLLHKVATLLKPQALTSWYGCISGTKYQVSCPFTCIRWQRAPWSRRCWPAWRWCRLIVGGGRGQFWKWWSMSW